MIPFQWLLDSHVAFFELPDCIIHTDTYLHLNLVFYAFDHDNHISYFIETFNIYSLYANYTNNNNN